MLVNPRLACWMFVGLAALAPFAAAQPVFTNLVAIGSATPLVLGADGALCGVGAGQIFPECPGGCGGMFSLTPPPTGGGPWTETMIYSFTSIQDGIGAAGDTLIMGTNGGLYGTTGFGGAGCKGTGCGTVFSLTPPDVPHGAWTKATFAFNGLTNLPNSLSLSNGVLYGTSRDGGTSNACYLGCGAFFSVTPPSAGQPAWSTHVLYSFTGGADSHPLSVVPGGNGEFFGTADGIGCPIDCGYVFSMTQAAPGSPWKETVLYTATDTDAANNFLSLVVGGNGVIYGTSTYGGAHGEGSVFSLTPPSPPGGSWTATTLYSFAGTPDAAQPNPGLIIGPGGALYGTSNMGGPSCQLSSEGCGTIFSLTPPASPADAWNEKILYAFTDGNDGAWPTTGVVLGTNGVLYGSTTVGPERIEGGFVFSLKP